MNERIVVGVILNSLTIDESWLAGGAVRTLAILDRWRALPFDLTFFAPAFACRKLEERFPRARLVAMPAPSTRFGRVVDFVGRSLFAILRRRELRACDVVFASSPFLPDVVPLAIAGRASVVLIAHVLPLPWRRPGSIFWNALAYAAEAAGLAIARRSAATVITLSNSVAYALRKRGFVQPCYVSSNGVEHISTVAPSPSGRAGAVCVARLHPAKGTEDLIDAWHYIVNRYPVAKLTLIGDGDSTYIEHVQKKIHALDMNRNIVLAGAVDDATRDKHLSEACIFIFPSYEEGWGIALAEAMLAGLPCVTYDLPVFREIFPTGRLCVPVGDVHQLSQSVARIFEDEALRQRLAIEGQRLARTFTWNRAAVIDARAVLDALRQFPSK